MYYQVHVLVYATQSAYITLFEAKSAPFSTRCGFYGNPIYLGYCSKCFKELVRDAPKDSAREGQMTDEQLYSSGSGVCDHKLY